ncbi:MAG: ABC transporter substrate-binding protein [Fimbriimonas sp.]
MKLPMGIGMNRFGLGLILCICFLAGCKGGFSSQTAATKKKNVLRLATPQITKIDPATISDIPMMELMQNVFEGLVIIDENNQIQPNLAESWTLSKDGRTYTFKIRKGVKFHNGREMTAHDVKYSIERETNPALPSQTAPLTYQYVVGAAAKMSRKASEISGLKVIDDYTISITIDEPRPYFLTNLTGGVVAKEVAPYDKEIWSVAGMVGTGAFKASRFEADQLLELVPNPEYWNGAPKLDGIRVVQIKESITRVNKFKKDELDLIQIEKGDAEALRKDPLYRDQIVVYGRTGLSFLGFNLKLPPFTDKRVRQAFSCAIDRERLCTEMLAGNNKPAYSIVPPETGSHRSGSMGYVFDPARARKLLAAAGFPGGAGFPQVTLNFDGTSSDSATISDAIVTDLRVNLGIKATTKQLPFQTFIDQIGKKELAMFSIGWVGDIDPQSFFGTLLSDKGLEPFGFRDKQFNAMVQQAGTFTGPAADRMRLYNEAEDIVLEEVPLVPLWYSSVLRLVSPHVKGLQRSASGDLPYKNVRIE